MSRHSRELSSLNDVNLREMPYINGSRPPVDAAEAKPGQPADRRRQFDVRSIIKALAVLAVIAFIALIGYAYLGQQVPPQEEIRQPVTLDVE